MDSDDEDKYAAMSAGDDDPLSNLILEVIKNDQGHNSMQTLKTYVPLEFCWHPHN